MALLGGIAQRKVTGNFRIFSAMISGDTKGGEKAVSDAEPPIEKA
jgi:hypothetical protein